MWFWLHWGENFTHQVLQSRGSWDECPHVLQTEEAGEASVSEPKASTHDGTKDFTWRLISVGHYNQCFTILCVMLLFPVISDRLLEPQMVEIRGRVHFVDAFCGAYLTFAVSEEGHVYGFGLSNYHQLG